MKTVTKLFGFAIIAITLSACGNNTTNPYGQNAQYNQNGQAGYYNSTGQFIPTGNTVGQGGCVPIQNGSFQFSVTGAAINSAVILAGILPQNSTHPGQYGQVVMGGASSYGGIQLVKQSQNGILQMSLGQGTVSGSLQLNQSIVQQLMYSSGSQQQQYPYNTGYNTNTSVCVSSIAIDAVYQAPISNGYSQGQGQIIQALVYLYLNNGQPVGPIPLY